jgi:tRNA(Ile)-lysidine synthase TilS/MesJ
MRHDSEVYLTVTSPRYSLWQPTGQAVADHHLIAGGDRVAIGLSGGKDSLVLVEALARLRAVAPVKFELHAITVDLGYPGTDFGRLSAFLAARDIPFTIVPTDIGRLVFEVRQEENPCALCANMRRGALNRQAAALGCNKVALAHHLDDAIETMLMGLLFEGRIHCFSPATWLSRSELTVIRPLIYVWEQDISDYARRNDLPILENPCPANHRTRREDMKQLVKEMEERFPGARKHLAAALRSRSANLPWGALSNEPPER